MDILCIRNDTWTEKKYCEYSCYTTGNGYIGSFCCQQTEYPSAGCHTSEYPSTEPSDISILTPSKVPRISKQSVCTACTNIASPEMKDVGEDCNIGIVLMTSMCNDNDDWKRNKYCEHNCYTTGNGYVGSFCCQQSEYPNAPLVPSVEP